MILAIGVDNSIGFTKEQYLFEYKGQSFKYVPRHSEKKTDDLVGFGQSEETIYALMTEFLSALVECTPKVGQLDVKGIGRIAPGH